MILASIGLWWRGRENVGRTQSQQALKGPINISCCSCQYYYAVIPPLLFLPRIWKWKVLGCIPHRGALFGGDLYLFGTCQLPSSAFMFSLQVVFRMLYVIDNDKTWYAVFFFLIPCQSAVPNDSRVGGPSSSHFQKVLLKISWGWRGRLLFLT